MSSASTPSGTLRPDDAAAVGDAFSAYGLSDEARDETRAAVITALETAGPDFGAAVRNLSRSVADADPIAVMAVIAMYLGAGEVGTNPESDPKLGMYQHHLELAQAMLLRGGAATGVRPLWRHVPGITEAVLRFTSAWRLLQLQKLRGAAEGSDRRLAEALLMLRIQSTCRGWAYESQLLPMLQDLLQPLDAQAREGVGFALSALPVWWRSICELISERLNRHRRQVQEALDWPVDEAWFERIDERFGRLPEPGPDVWTAVALVSDDTRVFYVTQCSDLRVHEIYRLCLSELVELLPGDVAPATVAGLMESWSLAPGDDGGVPVGDLVLRNPVVSRPFVRSGVDQWCLFCGWLPFHNPFELVERAIGGHQGLVEAYLERRATFLEERTAALLKRALPQAVVERSIMSTEPTDGREYENDILVRVSTYALIAEAKAGRLHADARRGRGSGRLLRDGIDDLLVRPSDQAVRLAARLEAGNGPIQFVRKADRTAFTTDAGEVRRTITLAVTIEPIALLLPRLSDMAEAGLSDRDAEALAYNISVTDLELVVEMLEDPSEFLHYLTRRTEIERGAFLRGDEADLLALYLQTGFNLGEHEFSGRYALDVTGLSDPIDVWHYRREAGLPAEKPRSERTPWWEAVLSRVESRASERWAEIGVRMCNVGPAAQKEFEAAMHELRRAVRSGERPVTDMLVFENGPPERRDLFVGLIATSADPRERLRDYEDAVQAVLVDHDVRRLVLLSWTPVPTALPYFGLVAYDVD